LETVLIVNCQTNKFTNVDARTTGSLLLVVLVLFNKLQEEGIDHTVAEEDTSVAAEDTSVVAPDTSVAAEDTSAVVDKAEEGMVAEGTEVAEGTGGTVVAEGTSAVEGKQQQDKVRPEVRKPLEEPLEQGIDTLVEREQQQEQLQQQQEPLPLVEQSPQVSQM